MRRTVLALNVLPSLCAPLAAWLLSIADLSGGAAAVSRRPPPRGNRL